MKNKESIAYKVVSIDPFPVFRSKYQSFYNIPNICIDYSKSDVHYPRFPKSHLFVFDSYQNASSYVEGKFGSHEIWKVTVTNARTPKPTQMAYGTLSSIQKFLKRKKTKKSVQSCIMPLDKTPTGTLICDSLKYIETVDSYSTQY